VRWSSDRGPVLAPVLGHNRFMKTPEAPAERSTLRRHRELVDIARVIAAPGYRARQLCPISTALPS
jgi:hypothetical protein